MRQYKVGINFVETEDFRFEGHDFTRCFLEITEERPYSLYTLPCITDPRWPMITVYSSKIRWTEQQRQEFATGNLEGLVQRLQHGEGIVGFQYDLNALTRIVPLSRGAKAFLPMIYAT